MRKIGFIGCGHMAKALIGGLKSNKSYELLGHDRNSKNIAWLKQEKIPFYSLKEVCHEANILMICVKPKDMYGLCSEMKTYIGKELKIVSVAAGITLENLKDALSGGKVYRAMPVSYTHLRAHETS